MFSALSVMLGNLQNSRKQCCRIAVSKHDGHASKVTLLALPPNARLAEGLWTPLNTTVLTWHLPRQHCCLVTRAYDDKRPSS
jgi:hypothetical protein